MKLMAVVLGFVSVAFSVNAIAAGDIEAGRGKAAVCAACHGAQGNSTNPVWPKLSGQHAFYISKELHDFRNKKRADKTMQQMAANLSDTDIEDMAAYFAEGLPTIEAANADQVKLGEQLYRGGNSEKNIPACIACHGPSGAGSAPAKFPRIGGQHAAYLAKALKEFKSESRDNDHQAMMRDIAGRMNNKEIEAVSSYISGLH
jgi:cytochrome c553